MDRAGFLSTNPTGSALIPCKLQEYLQTFFRQGVETQRLLDAQAAGELVIIPSADAIKIESEPVYIDRRGEEDLTCAGLIVLSMLCLMLAFVYIITGAF